MPDDKATKRETKPERAAETEAYTPAATHDTGEPSDVALASEPTAAAPSFRAPVPAPAAVPAPPVRRDQRPAPLLPGARIDDFEIVRMLGCGAFGHVYLARQISLDREVALKVSANRGSEGRTMARLEHAHIVQVFAEKVDPSNQRLLCMQLVPGVGLEKIIGALAEISLRVDETGTPVWTGTDLLAIIDRNASLPAALDPSALRDREALAEMDAVEATAWIGARLAEALDFAHSHGVLHRDIKPANILVNPYGRPMLADFNISSQQDPGDQEEMFGGTLAYMAPEHLDAFNPAEATKADAVTAQADLYSLGIVLRELLNGRPHVPTVKQDGGMVAALRNLATERRKPPECSTGPPCARKVLEQTICHCLAPNPANRYSSGATLAEQLEGVRQMRRAERQLPPPILITPWILRRPFTWLVVLVLLPQIAGSALNIPYNTTQIVDHLRPDQKEMFFDVVAAYNTIAYPLALAIMTWVVLRVWRTWRAMYGPRPLASGDVATARRKALRLPLWVAGLTACGWLPGGVLFPAVIAARTEGLSPHVWMHFIASFSLSGLIALAYSLCGSQFVIQRALYPRMWDDVRHFTSVTRGELGPTAARISWWIQLLAGSIPSLAAVLILFLMDEDSVAFKTMVAALIVLGMLGYQLATRVSRRLSEIEIAMTGAKA
jgi:serine/threonine protein kinase